MLSTKPLGLIDTLSEGFATLNRHLWILLLPIALDLLFAYGPGISMAPVVDRAVLNAGSMLAGADADTGTNEDAASVVHNLRQNTEGYRDANLLGVVAWQLPSVMSIASEVALPKIAGPVIGEVTSGPVALGYGLVLAVLGLAGSSLYLTALARAVLAEATPRVSFAAAVASAWLRLAALFGMVVVIGLPITVVGVLLVQLFSMLGSGVGQMLTSMLVALVLLAAFYVFFVQNALVLLGCWPLPAALASARVVRRHFWASAGFIILVTVIGTGMPLIWRVFIQTPLGVPAAILGHSYISTGLAAAGMLFFLQRHSLPVTAPTPSPQYPPPGV